VRLIPLDSAIAPFGTVKAQSFFRQNSPLSVPAQRHVLSNILAASPCSVSLHVMGAAILLANMQGNNGLSMAWRIMWSIGILEGANILLKNIVFSVYFFYRLN
jgi:hypothetical protein